MWWFVYSHQLHITQNWILKMQQGEILSSTYPVSHHFLWRLCIWSGQMPALTQPFLHSHNHETTWAFHIPAGSSPAPASLLPQCRQQFLNLFSNNHGPFPALWPWVQEQLDWAVILWCAASGNGVIDSGVQLSALGRETSASSGLALLCGLSFSFRIQQSLILSTWGKNHEVEKGSVGERSIRFWTKF